jgi:hypothetical protein
LGGTSISKGWKRESNRPEAPARHADIEQHSTKLQTRISSSEWVEFRVSSAR